MCGIAGSFNREIAFSLYQKNLERGRYSAGMLVSIGLHGLPPLILKTPVPFTLEDVTQLGHQYLFHSRAPTSRTIEYREIDTHPFQVGDVIVAHNGIITNATELSEEYEIDYSGESVSLVDSYVIPYIISQLKLSTPLWEETICNALSQLKGTFGLWIHIESEKRTFICRSGSTLYANFDSGCFSSTPQDDFHMLAEGQLYEILPTGVVSAGTFKTQPMYFIA